MMEFSDTTNGDGAVQEIHDICNSDSNSYPLKSIARRVNQAIQRFYSIAFQVDGRHSWDDPSKDSAPIETINLVSGTQSYNLDDFTTEIFNILRVEVLDSSGNSILLKRLNKDDVLDGLPSYQSNAGLPQEYDLIGEFIYLYPKPNYNSTNGLRLYINRAPTLFVSTDTTKTLPVPSLFNSYICRLASLPYLIEFQKGQKNDIASLIQQDEANVRDYFTLRSKGLVRRMTPKPIDYI